MKHLDGMADKALDSLNSDTEGTVVETTQEVVDDAPDPSEIESKEAKVETKGAEKVTAEAVADLSKFSKVKLDDRELTLEELRNGHMMQADYTKKTQELAKERKYYDNLQADLRAVGQDPSLASEFKRVYPEKFHRFLDVFGKQEAQKQSADKGSVAPEIMDRFSKYDEVIGRFEQKIQEDQARAVDAQLQVIEKSMNQKYPKADPVYAYTLAQEARSRWEQENGQKMSPEQLNQQFLEPFFKQAHEYQEGLFKRFQQEQVGKVKKANAAASDIGRGGGTPGGAPAKIKLKDVADYILNENEMG